MYHAAWIRTCLLMLLLTSTITAQYPNAAEEEALLYLLYGDEDMITIATGSQQSIRKAPAVATVITAQDIKEMGATDIDEALETVPGLHVARDVTGYNPIYTFRGIYSNFNPQVLMLINGIPITNLYLGDRNQIWGGMPVEAIQRIEVIRGPGSAVYGADAFAGVINIITKKREDIKQPEIGWRRGSFDTWDGWGKYSGDWGGFDVAFVLEYHNTNGQDEKIDADAQTLFDSAFGTSASLAPDSVNLGRENIDARLDIARGQWRLRAGLQRRRNWENAAGVAQALDDHNKYRSDRWNVDITYHDPEFAKNWDLTAQLSYLDTSQMIQQDLRLFPPGTVLPIGADGNINVNNPNGQVQFSDGFVGNPEVWERHTRVNLSAFYTGYQRHVLRGGVGFYYGDLYKVRERKNFGPGVIDGTISPIDGTLTNVSGTPFVFLPEKDRTNYYAFLQDVWSLANDWELTTGVRYDYYSDFGGTLNPRLALVWSTRHDLTTKVIYGRAFRAPAFVETRAANNPANLGNPDLDPETLDSLEVALDFKVTNDLRAGLNIFHYWWDDIILFVPDPGGVTRTARNAGQQNGYGLELEAEWNPTSNFRVVGNYAYQHSEDRKTNRDAGNAPHHQLYLRAKWEFLPSWQLNPQFNWVIDRDRVSGDNRPGIDDYAIVDLTLRRKDFKNHWEFALAVKNLFDINAREPSPAGVPTASIPDDLPLAGRSFFGEVRYRF